LLPSDDTPLHRAFYKNNIEMIGALLKKGADMRKVSVFVVDLERSV
jgi:ankyrin repeat protein